MEYVQSESGKWHRTDCQYSPSDDDEHESEDELPVDAEHCQHCIGSFEFSKPG